MALKKIKRFKVKVYGHRKYSPEAKGEAIDYCWGKNFQEAKKQVIERYARINKIITKVERLT